MRSHHVRVLVLGLGLTGAASFVFLTRSGPAEASIPASIPAAAWGAVQVSSAVATKIPSASMATRYAIAVQNLGPNDIWCGWSSAVTTATGWRVSGSGGVFTVDTGYTGDTNRNQLWCIASTATQVSPFDTRYQEVR